MREIHRLGTHSKEWYVPPAPELARAGILMAGVSEAAEGFRFVRLDATYPQVLVCCRSRGRIWLGGKWHTCRAGSAYVTPAGQHHAYHSIAGVPWTLAWILYLPGPKCPIRTPAPSVVRVDPRPLRDVIRGLYRETAARGDAVYRKAWIELLQLHGSRVAEASGSRDTLWPVWHAVAADLARPWTLNTLARAASVSPEHLRRLCHRQLGCTPMRQVARLRMSHAATLLVASPQRIESIAAATGYANRFAFSHAFRRHFNATPGAYRAHGG